MTITVKFFASLREEHGFNVKIIDIVQPTTVEQVWKQVSETSIPENLLSAVNHEYAPLDHEVTDGDEVAFFPPVNGG